MRIEAKTNVLPEENKKGLVQDKFTKEDNTVHPQKSFFAGNILGDEKMFANKERAQKQAMEIVSKVFEGQQKIDEEKSRIRGEIEESRKAIDEGMKGLEELDKEKEALRESYGVMEDSEEQKELELIIKGRQAMKNGSFSDWTREDQMKYLEAEGKERTLYQEEALEINASGAPYREMIENGKKNIAIQTQIIKAIKMEELKHHEMADAQREADKILDAASKAEITNLVNEAIEEKEQEQKEAEEIAKKKETSMEKRHKTEENQVQEQNMEETTQQIQAIWKEAQTEVEKLLQELKLLEEDIKGSEIDVEL